LPYTWNGKTYNAAGSYKDTLTSSLGCDSIVTLTLNVNPVVTGTQTATVCSNQLPYLWNGKSFGTAGTYRDTLTNATGCDSIVTLTLNVNPVVTGTQTATVCNNQLPYLWNGKSINGAGTYKDTLTSALGCDSIVTLTLNVNPVVTGTQTVTVCSNHLPYTWNGKNYNSAGSYKDTLISALGCDSIVTLTLNVNPVVTGTQITTVCSNQLPYIWNGKNYNSAGSYKDTLTSSLGCDSIVTLTLNVNPVVTGTQTATVCSNQLPYLWNGKSFGAAGTYKDTLTSALGCDSIVTLTLNVNPVVTGTQTATICSNQLPYIWNGKNYNAAGSYKDTLTSALGCDSIVTLTLNVNPVVTGTQTATVCSNQLPYLWNGKSFGAAGTYKDTLTSALGCDSIVTLTLNVNPVVTGTQTTTVCSNQLPYLWNGKNIDGAGTYKDTLTSAAGCDSIVTLTLNVNPVVTGTQTATVCSNQLPYAWNGKNYNAAGSYKDTLTSSLGCDSIVTLTLNVNPVVIGTQTATVCSNQLPYTWNGKNYNAAGSYKDTLTSALDCDSIVTLTLNVNPVVTGTQTVTICSNQLPYTWNGKNYNTAGSYKDTLSSVLGCDSIVTLTLNVNPVVTGTQAVTVCSNQLPYTWNGKNYNAAGSYKDTLTSAGCDSIVTLTLNVNPVVTGIQTVTVCSNQLPYTWNGKNYNSAGNYKDTLTSAAGCDSIVTLTLNVNPVVTGTQAASVCSNQLPYLWNGKSINGAGSYKDTLTSALGCDSIVTLTLNVNPVVTGTQTATVCSNQLPYTWNGKNYNAAGSYKDTLTSARGCDSIVTLTLNVNSVVTGTQTATVCSNQLPYLWNGKSFGAAGSYKDTLTSALGCDSIVTLTLNVNPVVTEARTATVCSNQLPYLWNGKSFNAGGTYKDTLTSALGCDSIVTLTLNVNPVVTGTQTATVCNNQLPYLWNGKSFGVAGTYNDTLTSAAGCDSIVTLTLNVNPVVTGTQTATVCSNQLPYTWNGKTYNAAGTYKDTLTSAAGCDSIVTLTLNVNPVVTGTQITTICSNQLPYQWNGKSFGAAGTYKDTLTSVVGCDSIVTLTLTVNPVVTGTQAASVCSNQLPYLWNGKSINGAGVYKDTLTNAQGCDSIVTLTLNVNPVVTGAQTVTICSGHLPYTWNGNKYNAAGIYKDTLTSALGCDSIVTLTLNINPVVTGAQTATVCSNQLPYLWNGKNYNAAGSYKDTLTSAVGCDSIVTLTLNVNPVVIGAQAATICSNQLPYTWNAKNYNVAGTYKDTLVSALGCDSIVTLTLKVNPVVTGTQTATVCSNQLPYIWNGKSIDGAGTYKDTLISALGCDSIVTLTLNVNPVVTGAQTATVCSNQLPYLWNGRSISGAGSYKDTVKTVAGCDSIVTLTLNVNPVVTGSQTVTICNNQLPYLWNGKSYNGAGTYKDTLKTVAGCDSIVTLTLNANPIVTGTQTVTVCSNQLPYIWNGNKYNTAGTYKDTLKTVAGCDSIVTLTLNVNTVVTGSQTVAICNNQLPYTWNGNKYNGAGTYKDTLKTVVGCDSIVTLTLNVNPIVTGTQTITICSNQLPYLWNGKSFNATGTYKDTLASAAGCDSIVTLTLNVNPVVTDSQTVTICNNQLPYTWNGNKYNAAGTYKDTLTNAAGCDSIVILTLNVNPVVTGTQTATVCSNQLPYLWNGKSFNAGGTYKDTLTGAVGCDSIVTLTLKVNPVVTGTQSATVCTNQLPYTWNGKNYNAAGSYKDTLTSAFGCDSIVTLTLNVNPVVTGTQTVTVCSNQLPYTWNGNKYNAAGTYKDTLKTAVGCDSIVTLTLNVNPVVTGTQTITICSNQIPYTWNGKNYNAAGSYKDTLTSALDCDSIVTLTLNVNPIVTGGQTTTVCSNQLPYLWNGKSFNSSGTYKDTLASALGCDSIVTLTLNVNPVVTGTQTTTVCSNNLPYLWNGKSISGAGTYKDTLTSALGCDSIVTLTLNVNSVVTGSQTVSICNNQLPYTWNGNKYNAAGTYKDTLISATGCDSIATLALSVNPVVTSSQTIAICNSQLPYLWHGKSFGAGGTYKDTLISTAGCDSIVTLTLTVNPVVTGAQTVTICSGQLPYIWNGKQYNIAGTYKDTLISAAGCDSIVTLTLNVNRAITGSQTITICNSQLPYLWNGKSFNVAGIYKDTLISTAGCDSIVTLTLNVNPAITGSQTATICNNQLPYTWNGKKYNAAGTYKDTLISVAGCDSIVTLTLNVNAVLTDSQTVTICNNQLPYTWNGKKYNASGTYKDTLTNSAGCDSLAILTLNINLAVTGSQIVTICNNQLPYTWNGNKYNGAGIYKDTLTNVAGCDSIVTLTLNVNAVLTDSQTVTICNNQLPYTWNGKKYNASGTYKDTLTNSAGCDSLAILTLNINLAVTGSQIVTICNNQLPYTWNGNKYNAAGTYKDTLTSVAGCDSIVTLTLNVNPIVTGLQTVTICNNQLPYLWNGKNYNAAGNYKDTLTGKAGCDSIATLTLNVNPVMTGSQTVTICNSQLPYLWNGKSLNAGGTYKDTLINAAGCDSIATLTLNVNPVVTGTQTTNVCSNQLPYIWNGKNYNAAGSYKDTLTSALNCDSIVTLILNVNSVVTGTQTATVCSNQLPYLWNGKSLNATGTYKDTLTSASGCDSIVTLTLNINPVLKGSQTVTICNNQLPYTWNNKQYNTAGTYKDTLLSGSGCDSIVTLTLSVNPAVKGSQTVTICNNQLPYTWNSKQCNTAGTYKDTLLSASGCDSIVTLTLNINPAVTSLQTITICSRQLPYLWNGKSFSGAGIYKDTMINAAGCDSIVSLTLNVNPAVTASQTVTICSNQLPYLWNGRGLNAAGIYKDTLTSASGCDSVVILTLNINPVLTGSQTVAVCSNQLPYLWNGRSINSAGTYKDTLTSATGCDSIVTLTLSVNSAVTGSQTITICNSQLPYLWNGQSLNATGTYKDTLTSATGCDSVVTLTLGVNSAVAGSQTVTICSSQLPYSWNGKSFNTAGTYKDTLISTAGCDSIVTLTLNVNPVVTASQTVTICNSQLPYLWNGKSIDTAGAYKDTLASATGCDSIIMLTLSVNPAITASQTVTICNSQLPYLWNGKSLNAGGTYKDTLTSAKGCDSIITLTLNVNLVVTGSQTVTICNNQLPYTWNSKQYNASGTYKDTLTSASGCDSIIILTLNVNPTVTDTQTVNICNSHFPYLWNGKSFNAAGTYKDTLTSASGCDSIITLTLNVNPAVTASQTVTICNSQLPYLWNGKSFNTAGTYKDTLISVTGCDSIVALTLNVNPAVTSTLTVIVCNSKLPYLWNGKSYNTAGTYKDTLSSASGCDSIVTLTLNVNPVVTSSHTVAICINQLPYTWNSKQYNAAGIYKDTLTSVSGCDSIVTLTLNVNPAVTGTQTVTICSSQLPYLWNGKSLNAAGTYKDTLISAVDCDSIVTLTLNVNSVVTGSQTVTVCTSQLPYLWNGKSINAAGNYKDTLTNAAGCDSIATLVLNVNAAVTSTQTITICNNQLPYTWNSKQYNTAETYKDTLTSAAGCDSIVTLTLNVNPVVTASQTVTICSSQLPYPWNGKNLNATGTYSDTLTSAIGCDSVVTLTLNVNPAVIGSQIVTVCSSQLPYLWNGKGLNAAGTYKDTLTSASGCDSIVTLTLNVNSAVSASQTVTVCNSQLPYLWNGKGLNAAGTYKDTLTSASGCDSIVTLTLNVNSAVSASQTVTVCNSQLPYLWNGKSLNAAGTYKDTLTGMSGCDSIVTLTLNVNSAVSASQTVTICNSQLPYLWNGKSLNAAGTYKDTLTNSVGCDSVVTLTLNVNPAVTGTQTVTICSSQLPYIWNGKSLKIAGTYKDTLTSVSGCDSIITLILNVNPAVTGSQIVTVCNSQLPYLWNDKRFNAAGTYEDTLASTSGCDSITTLTLNVNPIVTGSQTVAICNNQLPYTWNSKQYNAAGIYKDVLTSVSGCDSIVTLTLNVNPAVTGTQTVTICSSQLPYLWNGRSINSAGAYKDTLTSASGCDSIVTFTLSVNSAVAGSQTITICNSQLPYLWNGKIYNTAGTYKDTLLSAAGCDSIATLVLSVNMTLTSSQTVTICNSQLPYLWNGKSFNATGTYKDTLLSATGCDSIATLVLNVNAAVADTETVNICNSQLPYTWNGKQFNTAGTYRDTLLSAADCDSVVTLILNVSLAVTGSQAIAICSSQLPYLWNGKNLNAAGTYKDTLTSAAGCDSIATLVLNVNATLTSSQTINVCNSQLPYTWNGKQYSAAGTYKDTLASAAGCDSIAILVLNVTAAVTTTQTTTICNNQLPFTWNGKQYNSPGIYNDTLFSASGCDSIATLVLTVNASVSSAQTINVCNSQLPYIWNGKQYNAAGTYNDTLLSASGCDSIATLVLNVNTAVTSTQTIAICNSQLPYTWNGKQYNAAGTYMDTLLSASGCDSIVTLTLNVSLAVTGSQAIAICSSQLPYLWNGKSLNAAGTYKDTLTSATGCDSIATLVLNINAAITGTETINICNSQLPYTWNSKQYSAAGTYKDTLLSATGCDSIATLVLNVNAAVTGTETVHICNSQLPYTWNSKQYSVAGTYKDTLISVTGCDSIATLVLTVNASVTSTQTINVCNSQLPYLWNGKSLSAAGTYKDTLSGASGCDSITTLVLNINAAVTGSQTVAICSSQLPYLWNGKQYSAAGTYKDTLASASGCDSIATLVLNVKAAVTDTQTITICNSQLPYTWNGKQYNAAGAYKDTLISAFGCDSIATLVLNVNAAVTSTENITICNNQLPYTWNGKQYKAAGTYKDTLLNASGCDSVATLILNVNPVLTSSQPVTICNNQLPYTWNGKQYTTAGTYTTKLTSIAGCDSIVTLILTVKSSFTSTEDVSTCAGSYTLPNGTIATTNGVYKSAFVSISGCDSIVITHLTLNTSPKLVVNNPAIDCQQTSVDLTAPAITAGSGANLSLSYYTDAAATTPLVNPGSVTISGIYYIKAVNAAGCSVVKPLNVQISSAPTANISGDRICQGARATLTVRLTGKAPFAITYTDSNTSHTVTAITETTYQWHVSPVTNTTYTLTSVSDAYCSNNSIHAAAVVTVIPTVSSMRYPDVITSANQPTPLKARPLGDSSNYKWSPGTGLNENDVFNPVFDYSQRVDYLIYITSRGGCVVVDTQAVKLIARGQANEPPNLWVPTAWSPHKKDGHNDYLFPFTRNIVELRYFRVYDRWGQLMFETNQLGVGWDGIYKGVPQVMDTYTWTVEAVGNDGTIFKRAGNAMLLR
jgi:hypothetical protein